MSDIGSGQGLSSLLGALGMADYGAIAQQQAVMVNYPTTTHATTYTTNGSNTISFNSAPGQLPASGSFVPDEVAWLKQRVREIEWRP